MSTSFYRIYIEKILRLAKTLVIKSQITAEAYNTQLMFDGQMQDDLEVDWKYYKTLAGEYHRTHKVMTVVSLDTLDEIVFNKENLAIHRATAKAYEYGSNYYKDLLNQYPDQEDLILGILNPIDKNLAINSPDGTILYYDKSLVEPQERTLILSLQRWLYNAISRWDMKGYNFTDEFYPAAHLAVIFANVPTEIINIRLQACGTREVHSFHIREYLASNGGLDRYIPFLTLKQQLFLYRNLNYLYKNVGTTETFEILLQNIINERNLPLSRYVMRQKINNLDDELLPDVDLLRENLNDHPGDGTTPERSITDVMYRQAVMTRGNRDVLDEAIAKTTELMQLSQVNVLETKVLESALLDTTDSVPYSFEEVLVNHWVYYASTDRLPAVVNITHPVTGQRINLTAKEALVCATYLAAKMQGFTLEVIPLFVAGRVLNPVKPTLESLREVASPKYVKDATLVSMISTLPDTSVYLSLSSFYDHCRSVYFAMNSQRTLHSIQSHMHARGMIKNASRKCYMDICCDAYSGEYFEDWFSNRALDISNLNMLDTELFYLAIINEVSSSNTRVSNSLADMQRAMLGLMKDLSSYAIQYLQSVNQSAYRVMDQPLVKVGDIYISTSSLAKIDSCNVGVKAAKIKGVSRFSKMRRDLTTTDVSRRQGVSNFVIRTPVGLKHWQAGRNASKVLVPNMNFTVTETPHE